MGPSWNDDRGRSVLQERANMSEADGRVNVPSIVLSWRSCSGLKRVLKSQVDSSENKIWMNPDVAEQERVPHVAAILITRVNRLLF